MFKLLGVRAKTTPSYRTKELTPEVLQEARWKFERTIAHAMDNAIAAYCAGRPIPYPQPPPYLTTKLGQPWTNALYSYAGASAVTDTGPVLRVPAVAGYRVMFRG